MMIATGIRCQVLEDDPAILPIVNRLLIIHMKRGDERAPATIQRATALMEDHMRRMQEETARLRGGS